MTAATSAAGDGEQVLGLLRSAGLDLALPLAALREVVPCPEVLDDLPVAAAGLLGVMTLRSTMVPVLDLVLLLGREHPRSHEQVVVVVAHAGRLVGLLVDEIRGLATVEDRAFVEVSCHGTDLLFSRTFHHPTQGHVVSMIDADAVLALPGLPVVHEPVRVREETSTAALRTPTRSLTVVACGPFTLALDVEHVHSTIPTPRLSRSAADGPTCLGTTPVARVAVAVADVLALLGLGSLAGSALDCGLVLDLPDGQVVLGVSAMTGLYDVPEDRIAALPAAASPAPEILSRVADIDGVGPCLLVDGARLKATPEVRTLSRLTTPLATTSDDGPVAGAVTGGRAAGPPHLSYRAGVDLATPLDQVVEVLAYPKDLVASRGAPGVLGFVMHRGAAVPVLCLADVLGREAPDFSASSRLLLLDVDGESLAFAVFSLHAILALAWTDPASGRPSTDVLRSSPLIQLEGSRTLLPALDLVALARSLRPPAAPEPPTGPAAAADLVPAPRLGSSVAGSLLAT